MGRAGAVVSTGTDANALFKRRRFSLPPGAEAACPHSHDCFPGFLCRFRLCETSFQRVLICSADPSSHKQRSSALPLASWGLSPRAFHFYTPALVPG